ncbi:MAG TPA: aldehyde dehydrogenase family protein [Bdellovibrionales bacterium]|nr:aldehyde dehydrogenase family protein [Bdellovibrionales bacterium]
MSARIYKLWIAGQWQDAALKQDVRSPYSQAVVAQMSQCDERQVEQATAASVEAFAKLRKLSRFMRSRLLASMAQKISERRADFVERIISEAGKPRGLADVEVTRAVSTFTIASEEVKRFGGEIVPVDIEASGRLYSPAQTSFVPRGPVLAITPFNFPLNLVAHKVAPALAVGASVVVKPPPQAPGAAVLLAEIFEQAARDVSDTAEQVPLASLQVLSGANALIEKMVIDPRLAILSFTGSDKVGWMLQQKALRKKVSLELGGNAAVIVHSDADLKRAAARCAFGGYAYAGQVCISVQRILVQESVAAEFERLLIDEVKKLKVGDPADNDTMVGPLIDQTARDRLGAWIKEAIDDGARALVGGKITGQVVEPLILKDVKPHHKINTEEAFGPVVTLETYKSFESALEAVNRSRFGLQAGLFTDSASRVRQAIDDLDVGGVIINEVPTYRADNMPYGGMKESGLGREGVRYTMHDYCEIKTVVAWQGSVS